MYRTLNPDKIIETVSTLGQRIEERFPGSGLSRVCAELAAVAKDSKERVAAAGQPHLALRLAISLVLLSGFALLVYVGSLIIAVNHDADNVYSVLQGIDASFNIIVLVGAAALFLITLESRRKRARALADLHELRSIVHVIDMHQLTKDPSTITMVGTDTASSPERPMNAYDLTRYLDYCSEMLSLSAKVAALYAQSTKDPVVVDASSDLGQITSNLSNKIWQKINILERAAAQSAVLAQRSPIP
jgi:hypothetical protein